MAEKAIKEGYIDLKKPTNTIAVLIKYYYNKGMDKVQIREEIDLFMKKNYTDFNAASWQKTLDNMVKTYAKDKYKLIDIDSVNITKGELDTIRTVNNVKLEKLLFVYMVYAKVLNKINDKNNNWVNKDTNLMFKTMKLTETGKQQKLIVKDLCDKGYLQVPVKVNGTSLRVNFINEQSEIVYVLKDFDNIDLAYAQLIGENIGSCEKCGALIKQTTSNKKYCSECSKEVDREKARDRMRNIRNVRSD
jgi:hypothetical protein